MSEQSAIAELGDSLFGRGIDATLQALGKAYELAFMKGISQLSSPTLETIVDRTGHVGIAREIANYKVSLQLAQSLGERANLETDPRMRQVLQVLSAEFAEFGHAAGQRIVHASAYANETMTVEEALSEIFQASPEFVATLLAPTPGHDWSAYQIVGTLHDVLSQDSSVSDLVEYIAHEGVWIAAQSMTDLSLGLEAHLHQNGSAGWHGIAAQAGGAALLLHALFTTGYAEGLSINEGTPFYEDTALVGMVGELLTGPRADFSVVVEYLPEGQALAWLVQAIDAGFTTDELNELVDGSMLSSEGVDGIRKILEQLRAVLVPDGEPVGIDPASYYRAVFSTIGLVHGTYPEGLELESLVAMTSALVTEHASQQDEQGLAYRYALSALNGFALVGADYSLFNGNGELDLYDDETGFGTFTLEYLTDRPELLAAMLQANVHETAADETGAVHVPGIEATYIDREAGVTVTSAEAEAGVVIFDGNVDAPLIGTAGDDRLHGEGGDDLIFGGAGHDYLSGGEGNDHLEGGDGDDILDGGAGDDVLIGGAGRDVLNGGAGDDLLIGTGDGDLMQGGTGFDRYVAGRGDVIRDTDGSGEIVFIDAPPPSPPDDPDAPPPAPPEETPIVGGTQVDDSPLFVSDDGKVVYRENDDGSIDLWVDGERLSILPGEEETAPRSRGVDGSAPIEAAEDGEGAVVGKPMLGVPLRNLEGPREPSYRAPFDLAMAVPAPRRDPLVLDLDGDGIETLGQQAVTFFDHDANGFAELTGWVHSDDGLLALDLDGNGRIDSGRELFGDQTLLADGSLAASGAQALAQWDVVANGGNGDGIISDADAVWANLRVWRDLDGDGFSDAGELYALAELSIASISLSFADTGLEDGMGNAQARLGSFQRTDGSSHAIGEYLLARNTAVSIAERTLQPGQDVAALPEVRGSGNVHNLRQAMTRDAGLGQLVTAFTQEAGAAQRNALLHQILFHWAGADGLDPGSRGDAIDARKVAVLESFLAQDFVGTLGPNPVPEAAVRLEQAYHQLSEQVYAKLMAQTHLDALYEQITYRWDASDGRLRADLTAVTAAIDAELDADPALGKVLLSEFARTVRALDELPAADYQALRQTYAERGEDLAIAFDSGGLNAISYVEGSTRLLGTTGADALVGGEGNDNITAYDGNDVIYGLGGDDTISGCEGDDIIYGGSGNDNLFGGEGNDVLDGGTGNDYLNGGTGNDTYVLARGGGMDRIRDYDTTPGNHDVIRVAAGLTRADVRYWREGDDLLVGIVDSADAMRVESWFLGAAYRVEEVQFADGIRISTAELAAAHFTGTAGADVISGSDAADMIEGLAGDDVLFGGHGDDVLDGGAGDDVLYGGFSGSFGWAGSGNDTYVFARGYGRDVVYDYDTTPGNVDTVRLVGLNAADVTLRRQDNDLYIDINGTQDSLKIAGWGLGPAHRIERVEFADGSVLEGQALLEIPFLGTAGADYLVGSGDSEALSGLEGDDVLFGGHGDDVLDGGAGNDVLYGGFSGTHSWAGSGNDTYIFARGYGRDVIYDHDTTPGNTDTVRLVGLNPADVTIRRDADHLYIAINGSDDELKVANWGLGAAHRIERIEFADGSVLEGEALGSIGYVGTEGADTLTGTGENDTLRGLGGNDVLAGGHGDDVLDGGAGNDILYGGFSGTFSWAGSGNDTYIFARGYGQDVIYDYDTTPGNTDTIRLVDLVAADVTIWRDATNFYIGINGTSDQIMVAGWSLNEAYRIERVEFADGTVLDAAALAATPFMGTSGADILTGTAADDVIRGLGGNDFLYGGAGDDVLDGGPGNDTLYGGAAGYGPTAGAGNDIYIFGRGYGQDVIYDHDTTPGNLDTVVLAGLTPAEVTLRRDANQLYISINGTSDVLRVANWGAGPAHRIERVEFADGSFLDAAALADVPYLGSAGNDSIVGTADDEVMLGLGGNDMLAGGAGNDLLDGGDGNDTLKGEDGDDILLGGAGNDILYGGAGNDILDGGTGNDRMFGYDGDDVFYVDSINDRVYENINEGNDTIIASISFNLTTTPHVENLTLVGSDDLTATGNTLHNVLRGNSGDNVMSGGAGNDHLDGGAGDDVLQGGSGADFLQGGSGVDLLQGGDGDDVLRDSSGAGLLDGGAGADDIVSDGEASFVAGGKGDDNIVVNGAASVVAHNAGDGNDTLRLNADKVTLSLGGGTAADDLRLRKMGDNLVMEMGSEKVTLAGWYDSTQTQPTEVTLQMIAESIAGLNLDPLDALLTERVQQFDFKQIAAEFDAALAEDPLLDRWTPMHQLLDARLASSDTEALGGELAYQYAMNGNLAGMSTSAAQETLRAPAFAQQAQSINPDPALQLGPIKLL